jgi:hypothetical protein
MRSETGPAEHPAEAVIRRVGKPKARLFGTFAFLWVLPSIGAVFLLIRDLRRLLAAGGFRELLNAVTFEQWTALAILAAHGMFLWLALYYRKHEPTREECFDP